jgi:nicotinamidase-related amidase
VSKPVIDARHAMLLLMDYQPAILGLAGDASSLLERAGEAVRVARQAGMGVGYVRVAFTDSDLTRLPQSIKGFGSSGTAGKMMDGTPETAVHPSVAPEPGDLVVRKTRVGAFSTTDLDEQLRGRGIGTLVLAGISTSGVVLSTVRHAADRDYRLYVLEDACADRDPEVHGVLMRKVFPRQAEVIAVADLPGLLDAR